VQAVVENYATANDLILMLINYLEIDDFSEGEEALAIWFVSPLLGLFIYINFKHLFPKFNLSHLKFHSKFTQKWPAFLTRFTKAEEHEIFLDEPLLVLKRNVMLTFDRELQLISKYEKLAQVLYFDARDKYLSGKFSVAIESSLELVGLQLAIEFGPYNGNDNKIVDLI
ncbi:FERM domain-containing protein, partial [Meloidogyne graminicola]